MFGLTFEKLLLIGVIAAFIIGPERLPAAAQKLRDLVHWAKGFAGGAKERLREEMGDEFDDVDWRKLDPRQYDPRRIIREALLDDDPANAPGPARQRPASPGEGAATTAGARRGAASGTEVVGPAMRAALADAPAGALATATTTTTDSGVAEDAAALPTPFDPEAT